jgi:hypothetical protein
MHIARVIASRLGFRLSAGLGQASLQLGQNAGGQGEQAEIAAGAALEAPVQHAVAGRTVEGLDPVLGQGGEALPLGPLQEALALHGAGLDLAVRAGRQKALGRNAAQPLLGMVGTGQVAAGTAPPRAGWLRWLRSLHGGWTHGWRGGTGGTEVNQPSARARGPQSKGSVSTASRGL